MLSHSVDIFADSHAATSLNIMQQWPYRPLDIIRRRGSVLSPTASAHFRNAIIRIR